MILIDCPQRSDEWFDHRKGIITASSFDKILTPAKLEPAKPAAQMVNRLAFERMTGENADRMIETAEMERGRLVEPQARDWYAWERESGVREVGFCLRDDRSAGCSPDGLVREDGGVEIKCPMGPGMIGYLRNPDSLVKRYRGQVQGSLWVTGRAWWDVLAFCPGIGGLVIRVEPDPEYQAAISAAVANLNSAVETAIEEARRNLPRDEPNAVRCPISDEPMGDF